jgi:hypothetical protein
MFSERRKYIQERIIDIYNDSSLSAEIKNNALKVDMLVNNYSSTDEQVEQSYQSLQCMLCDELLSKTA